MLYLPRVVVDTPGTPVVSSSHGSVDTLVLLDTTYGPVYCGEDVVVDSHDSVIDPSSSHGSPGGHVGVTYTVTSMVVVEMITVPVGQSVGRDGSIGSGYLS